MRSISLVISYSILQFSSFVGMLYLFRPYQLMDVKRKVILVCCFEYCLEVFYIIALQALGISHSKPSFLQLIPTNVITVISLCLQIYFAMNHFCIRRTRRSYVKFFFQMTGTSISLVILAVFVAQIIFPAHNKQSKMVNLKSHFSLLLLASFSKYSSEIVFSDYTRNVFYPDIPISY